MKNKQNSLTQQHLSMRCKIILSKNRKKDNKCLGNPNDRKIEIISE